MHTPTPPPEPTPPTSDSWAAWLRLLLSPGIGRRTARRLLEVAGTPEQLLSRSQDELRSWLGPVSAEALSRPPDGWAALCARTDAWLALSPRHHVLPLGHPHYPTSLLESHDPPLLLYAAGDLSLLTHARSMAVVGTRHPTPAGKELAHTMAADLARAGVCVVSGLASGIDGAAHRGALSVGGATLAVVGTGLDRVYPAHHRTLAHDILAQGLLLSEYPLGSAPLPAHFPQRNRIIAALSQATLVLEATPGSGSLITAMQALEQGREVMAVPGSVHALQSQGCHALIRQGARLVTSADDILDDMNWASITPSTPPAKTMHTGHSAHSTRHSGLSDTQSALLTALGHDPIDLDQLLNRTGLPIGVLQAELLELELSGQVHRLPGGRFQRSGRA